MKITQEINFKGDYRYILEIKLIDLVHSRPSRFATMTKQLYNKSKKISDLLMWLSEEVKAIEDSK